MYRILIAIAATGLVASCDVYPVAAPVRPAIIRPVGIAPGPGYGWRFHEGFGWGWYHPRFGWVGRYY